MKFIIKDILGDIDFLQNRIDIHMKNKLHDQKKAGKEFLSDQEIDDLLADVSKDMEENPDQEIEVPMLFHEKVLIQLKYNLKHVNDDIISDNKLDNMIIRILDNLKKK